MHVPYLLLECIRIKPRKGIALCSKITIDKGRGWRIAQPSSFVSGEAYFCNESLSVSSLKVECLGSMSNPLMTQGSNGVCADWCDAPGTENPLSHWIWCWMNPPSSLLAFWGNMNWPPSMKLKKLKIFRNKMSSMGCKWSSLNAPGTVNPLSHSILKLDESLLPITSPLG